MSEQRNIIAEGEEKRVFEGTGEETVQIEFKDDTTAFHGIKRARLKGKGSFNCLTSSILFRLLEEGGIPTHFISYDGGTRMTCRRTEIIPLHVVVRNRMTGSTAELLGREHGERIPNRITELRYKSGDRTVGTPMINDDHAVALGIVTYGELQRIKDMALRIDDIATEAYSSIGVELIDFRIEFGKTRDGEIVLADELSPDNARLWDVETGNSFDKDRFRRDMSDVCASYREVMTRLEGKFGK